MKSKGGMYLSASEAKKFNEHLKLNCEDVEVILSSIKNMVVVKSKQESLDVSFR
jgi:hypothetical protein